MRNWLSVSEKGGQVPRVPAPYVPAMLLEKQRQLLVVGFPIKDVGEGSQRRSAGSGNKVLSGPSENVPGKGTSLGWSRSALGQPVVHGFLTSCRKDFTTRVQVMLRAR
ncbi:unnamed protein product [Pipistrellus nathusii]|uniref:Uncharacterized protein n=1 Tax=Pipistrellus nathusii TaxID=59473 RepID=A0ABN9ZEQ1_PIPNA